jgi:hypothetical protein
MPGIFQGYDVGETGKVREVGALTDAAEPSGAAAR